VEREGAVCGHAITAKPSAAKQEISGKPETEKEREHEQYCSNLIRLA